MMRRRLFAAGVVALIICVVAATRIPDRAGDARPADGGATLDLWLIDTVSPPILSRHR
ncbi:hypothetical protein [Sphingopyxis sp. YF1]|uniref:hypothetical protein n=1 Tax=Sphingopyxis sp. YF1 TaxID=2482763 RepID=UPI001F601F8C|nr:hypothetical protein [Sphingopyxis sp. YF1]